MGASGSGTSVIAVSGKDLCRHLDEYSLGGGVVGGELGRPASLQVF